MSNTTVTPAGVFLDGVPVAFPAEKDKGVSSHAEAVAGIMIAKNPGPRSVAPDAILFASTGLMTEIATQRLLNASNQKIRAVNFSFGVLLIGKDLDGNSSLTQFVDWSARVHNVVYCVSGNAGTGFPFPTDTFNGVVVGSTDPIDGIFRKVNRLTELTTATNGRHLNSLVAPGGEKQIEAPALGSKIQKFGGSSAAAPHVTGTVALLQEFAESRLKDKAKNWDKDAHQHQVMKAVLLNSADKLKDEGDGKRLKMEKEIVQLDGKTNWLTSKDHDEMNPLDTQLGTGQLNAHRSLAQFHPGKHHSAGTANVPLIG